MKAERARKFPPQNERASDLRTTVISCIVQKLRRMNLEQLREILNASITVLEREKLQDHPHAGQTVRDVHQSSKTDISKITP